METVEVVAEEVGLDKGNANTAVIKNGVLVVAYNGTGREGRGSAGGGVYLLKDAMVVPIYNSAVPAQRVRCIQI